MESFARIVRLHGELKSRRGPVSVKALQERLECSRPTVFRLLAHLRDVLGAPIENAHGRGYFYDRLQPAFELPGFWLGADELHALVVMDELLQQLEPGVLHDHVRPFRVEIERILARANKSGKAMPAGRVRLLQQHARRAKPAEFAVIAGALLQRKRLEFTYRGRAKERSLRREVSPQRLVHYRDNWYLDAWCHLADDVRVFSLDRIAGATCSDADALDVSAETLDGVVASSYGIFAGPSRNTARLLFTPHAARWVADEQWHPQQRGQFRTDGSYELEVPYGDARELVKDILRHGADVKVLGPKSLANAVVRQLSEALLGYQRPR